MPSISLTLPISGTVITAGLHSANYTALQSLLNSGLDTANWATGKIFAPSKLLQEAATSGQTLRWNGTSTTWVPDNAYGTTLPASPFDGQEAVLVDSVTLPTYQWRFRWNAGSSNANKWEFVGGAPLQAGPLGSISTSSTTMVDLTSGPTLTVPRAGAYLVETEIFSQCTTFTAGYNMQFQALFSTAGAGKVWTGAIGNAVFAGSRAHGMEIRTGLVASETVKIQVDGSSTHTSTFNDGVLRLTPIRVS